MRQYLIRTIVRTTGMGVMLWVVLIVGTQTVFAQEGGLTMTVAPPLFQLNLQPGEQWASGIQVVNNNPYDITVYAEPVLFTPAGEEGRPAFTLPPTVDGQETAVDPSTFPGWISVPRGPIEIQGEQTSVVPIAIRVPEDASPGGHYAAVLIGNRAPEGTREDGSVSVTSSIASLFFLRVAGTVVEDGRIRDFATEQLIYDTAEARLSVRFENQGNVHLQPQGDITIYNMFGKKRGYIPINQGGDYGNVLPGSIRKFTFTWTADSGTWDIGRYRAEATLGYGAESKQFAQSTTYFYILPLVPLIQMLLGIMLALAFFGWAVRAYIRRAFALEATRHAATLPTVAYDAPHTVSPETESQQLAETPRPSLKLETLIRPIQAGIVDLRSVGEVRPRVEHSDVRDDAQIHANTTHVTARTFLYTYRYFFLFVVLVALLWLGASAFFADVLTLERGFNVTEERADGSRIILSEPE